MRACNWVGAVVATLLVCGTTLAAQEPMAEKYLTSGKLAEGERALQAHLEKHEDDQQARYGLGVVQFIRGIERLSQSFYRHGLEPTPANAFSIVSTTQIPFLRLPVPKNPKPERLTYKESRRIMMRFISDMQRAEATLSEIDDPDIKLPLHFGLIRLDLNRDGKATDDELLWKLYSRLNAAARRTTAEQAAQFVIVFDKADVHWLRGYCHLLSALGEVALAHDWEKLMQRFGPYIFKGIKPSKDAMYLAGDDKNWNWVVDVVAAIHVVKMPMVEPERMRAAHAHLHDVIAQSRKMWSEIAVEKDNDREWIPGPDQKGVIPNVRVTKDMIEAWHEFLDEAERIIDGKTLIPHWRIAERGVNVRRVFTEPQDFDLILWIQGTAAMPYAEKGKLTEGDTWNRLQRTFGGNFIGFAAWFN